MAETILTQFRRTALRRGDETCWLYKKGGRWVSFCWADVEEKVRRLSLGLVAIGLRPGEKVGLLSDTRMEWSLMDLSILAAGAVTVPIYATLSAEQAAFIVRDSGATLLAVEQQSHWEKLQPHLKDWRHPVVVLDGPVAECFLSLDEIQEKGKSLAVNLYDENLRQLKPTDLATIVYTSGTTGPPKGVMLTHRNLTAEVEGLQEVLHFSPEAIGMMCLPLSHVIARALQFYQLAQGCQAAYAESLEKLPENLLEVRPHFMAVVPRLLEKSRSKILAKGAMAPWPIRKGLQCGLQRGSELIQQRIKKQMTPLWQSMLVVWIDLLLFRKVRKAFGGRMHCFISGGAPLSKELALFFRTLGMIVLEGYGLTETFAAVTLNRPDDCRLGTVGKPLSGVRVKINDTGEVCVKGDMVFSGYFGLKVETGEAFDPEGWFLTGDIGEFTKDGFLRITDRKKDLIVTSGGKNISPQNIEGRLQQSTYIQQGFVYGDGRKFLSALLTLNWAEIESFAKQRGISFVTRQDLANNQKILALLQAELDRCSIGLSSFEAVKKFAIVESDFTIEAGELTPTMKLKRKVVAEKYKNILESFYQE